MIKKVRIKEKIGVSTGINEAMQIRHNSQILQQNQVELLRASKRPEVVPKLDFNELLKLHAKDKKDGEETTALMGDETQKLLKEFETMQHNIGGEANSGFRLDLDEAVESMPFGQDIINVGGQQIGSEDHMVE